MLVSSIVGLAVLATILLAADWYIWAPRHRATGSGGPEPELTHRLGKDEIDLRSAA